MARFMLLSSLRCSVEKGWEGKGVDLERAFSLMAGR